MSELQERNNTAVIEAVNELNKRLSTLQAKLVVTERQVALQKNDINSLKQQLSVFVAMRGKGPTSGH